jgi:hypothetical protein
MRFINALLAMAAIALAVASVASAAPTVTLLWMGTTGTGTAGGSSIASKAGDTLTLDILITTDSTGVGFSGASYEISTSGTVTAGTIWPGADSIINWFGTVAYTDITGTATYAARGLTFVSGVTCPYPATGNAVDGCALGTLPVNATGADQANGIVGSFAAGPGGFQDKFTYTQARAQFEVVSIGMDCWLTIEVNALRGGAGHANSGGTKEITAKARIVKGTAPLDATVDDTTLFDRGPEVLDWPHAGGRQGRTGRQAPDGRAGVRPGPDDRLRSALLGNAFDRRGAVRSDVGPAEQDLQVVTAATH